MHLFSLKDCLFRHHYWLFVVALNTFLILSVATLSVLISNRAHANETSFVEIELVGGAEINQLPGLQYYFEPGIVVSDVSRPDATQAELLQFVWVNGIPYNDVINNAQALPLPANPALGSTWTVEYYYEGPVFSKTVTRTLTFGTTPIPPSTPPPAGPTPDPTANFLGLVPCGDGNIICTPCHLVELAQRIMNFFVFVVVIVAALLFVNAGVLYLFSPASPANIARAHRIFINTLIGLIIILASFLFIDTMMKIFYGDRAPGDLWGPWNNIICEGVDIAGPEPAPPAPGTAPGPISPPPPLPTAGDVRINLAESGVGVNKVECPEGMRYQDVRGGCTSVECLDPVSVSKIVAMRDACGPACEFVVTGGCELGHAGGTNSCTHGGGDKWDLRTTGATNALVTNSNNSGYFTSGTFRGRTGYTSSDLEIFCIREDQGTSNDHWDCYRTNC